MRTGCAEQGWFDRGRAEGEGMNCGGGGPSPEGVGFADVWQPEHPDDSALVRC